MDKRMRVPACSASGHGCGRGDEVVVPALGEAEDLLEARRLQELRIRALDPSGVLGLDRIRELLDSRRSLRLLGGLVLQHARSVQVKLDELRRHGIKVTIAHGILQPHDLWAQNLKRLDRLTLPVRTRGRQATERGRSCHRSAQGLTAGGSATEESIRCKLRKAQHPQDERRDCKAGAAAGHGELSGGRRGPGRGGPKGA
mmetsp:Transcript_69060/g.215706  ORF Transcript_69060/g.215706 Transcript_69060/m.215706 type:complete len:200 (-) Transcript_69060:21-620(-)